MIETKSRYPRLSFERPSYENGLHDGLRTMAADARELFLSLMDACVGKEALYIGKVVMGTRPFAVHLYEPGFPDNVVAWLAPRQTHTLVRLYRGTYVGDVLNLVTNPNMRGTPHPMNLRIKAISEIPIALACIDKSARLRNPR